MMTDHVALVTGGGRNIGRAVVLALAGAGVEVAINVRSNRDEGEVVAAEARALGVRAMVVVADVTDPDADEKMIDEVESDFGPIGCLVNCPSPRSRALVTEISVDDWHEVLEGALSATFYLARSVLPKMVDRGYGRIIAIGGAAGAVPIPRFAHVVAAKHGLVGLIKAIALDYGESGITANLVSPGWTDTSRDPKEYPNWPPSRDELATQLSIPRLGQPSEIAAACVYLASDDGGYVTGHDLHVNGGLKLV